MDIRAATIDDAEAIRAIYNQEVLTSIVTFDLAPRTAAEQRAWITERSGAHAVLVAVADDDEIVGFGALSPYRNRAGYSTSVEDSVYVHRDHQGAGIGRAILSALVEQAELHGFHAVFARIVDGHEASIHLHRSLGFEIVGVEREVGRKFGRFLDVVVMQIILGGRVTPAEARVPGPII
ncbi:MAG: N-acetyltransferase [Actinobacteria bacterium]|nr:N-acetyltransferase [Actinomycetota bacterium]